MTHDTDNSPATGRRWMKPLLVTSILVNLFLVGLLVGGHFGPGGWKGGDHPRPMGYMAQDLSPESRDVVRQIMKPQKEELKALWGELRREREQLSALIKADPADLAAIEQSLQNIRRIDEALQKRYHVATLEIVKALPAEERAKLNFRWRKPERKGQSRDGGRS